MLNNKTQKSFGVHFQTLKEVAKKLPKLQASFKEAKTEGEDGDIEEVILTTSPAEGEDACFLLSLSRYKTQKYLWLKAFKNGSEQKKFIGSVRLSDIEQAEFINEIALCIEHEAQFKNA